MAAQDSMILTQWAKEGKHEKFDGVDPNPKDLEKHRDSEGNSVLSTAAFYGHQKSCEKIMGICPALLYIQNNEGSTVLHRAVFNNKFGTLQSLVRKAKPLYLLDLLSVADEKGDTAMHLAVRKQNLKIVNLLNEKGPALEYSANESRETPLSIAFEKALTGDPASVEIRQYLIQKRPALCKVPSGIRDWSLIHHAVDKGDLNATKEIILEFPNCLEWVDKDDRNPLHILAANSEHADLGKYIMGLKDREPAILNKQDINGDTPLHIAAAIGNESFAKPLLYNPVVNKFIRNNEGHRTFDGIKFHYDKKKAGVFGHCAGDEKDMIKEIYDKQVKDDANFDLLVAALIATVSFAAGIAVPGGYNSEGPNKGTAVLASKTSFKAFMVFDAIALLLSLYAVLSHFAAKHIVDEKTMLYQVKEARWCSLLAIFAMMAAFASGIYSVLAVSDEFAITLSAVCSSFFLFGLLPLCRTNAYIRKNILLRISSYGMKFLGINPTTEDGSANGQGKHINEKQGLRSISNGAITTDYRPIISLSSPPQPNADMAV